jgi:hypothetical protein
MDEAPGIDVAPIAPTPSDLATLSRLTPSPTVLALSPADLALTPCPDPPLADLCDHDPLDLERDPRLRTGTPTPTAAQPCGALCTPWCLTTHT